MNKYDTNNLSYLRLSYLRRRYGLFWRKSYPTVADLPTWALVALIALPYLLVRN